MPANALSKYLWFGLFALAVIVAINNARDAGIVNVLIAIGASILAALAYRIGQDGRTKVVVSDVLPKTADAPSKIDFTAFNALPLPSILVDEAARLLQSNKAATREFGELPLGGFVTAKFREPEMVSAFNLAVAQHAPASFEMHERVPFERWYRVDICPVHETGSQTKQFVILFRDISEAHNIERMRADFVANASHELRTPLASLTGFIETLRGPARNDEKAREKFLGIMLEQAGRMSRLIDDLLSLSRLEMRPTIDRTEPIDIAALTSQVIDALSPMAKDSGVAIERKFDGQQLMISGVRDELIQVLENLIENACKYGKSGGKVAVSIETPKVGGAKELVLTVRDFGPGIAAEHIPRLTERFYRATPTTGTVQKGTGLGLAIVKHILSRHKGRLTIQSKLGEGSSFAIHLPIDTK